MLMLAEAAKQVPDDTIPELLGRHRSGTATSGPGLAIGTPSSLLTQGAAANDIQTQHEVQDALRAWSKMRMVRAGWFTAQEAMDYVQYFYDRLAPMTPITTPDFKSPSKHASLLTDEPVLALTILAISSRHLRPKGYSVISRSYEIHSKLWASLRRMVERLLWGQEQFGGGFCGSGATRIHESTGGQFTWKGSLRTLGTIEALLLLTDWQPRALHFPPGDDDNRLLDGSLDSTTDVNGSYDRENDLPSTNIYESLPYASWLEPAWRSDRMSWMLLGTAQALAFELGVFDTGARRQQQDSAADHVRKERIRRMVLVYVAQTSGRIGIPSMLDLPDCDDASFELAAMRRVGQSADDIMQNCWVHIASIMYSANINIFPSRQHTKNLTSNGKYKEVIAEFAPRLKKWKSNFDQVSTHFRPSMRHILRMEYEYARLYINSLGLQRVVESWVEHGSSMQKAMMVRIVDENKRYIDEVTDAAHSILTTVLTGLSQEGRLADAPVRTYLRTLSGMMFTLKVS